MQAVLRECGTRVPGQIYAECRKSRYGQEVESFLVDPPIKIKGLGGNSKEGMDVSALGVTLFERYGTWHILDWIGQGNYPNVADFVEEVRRYGVSRKLPSTLDFSRLTPDSKMFLVHARAWIDNAWEYPDWECPKAILHHKPQLFAVDPSRHMCAGIWWNDVDGEVDGVRQLKTFSYECQPRPASIKPRYEPAIFAAFPISNLVVIGGGEKTADNLAKASKSSIGVEEVMA